DLPSAVQLGSVSIEKWLVIRLSSPVATTRVYISGFPSLDSTNASVESSGDQEGAPFRPLNLVTWVRFPVARSSTKIAGLVVSKDTYATRFMLFDQAGDRIGSLDLRSAFSLAPSASAYINRYRSVPGFMESSIYNILVEKAPLIPVTVSYTASLTAWATSRSCVLFA